MTGTVADNARDCVSRGRNVYGNSHPRSKLSDKAVEEAKVLHAAGESYRDLANRYGVSKGAIAHIFQGITWKHV
jgi:hypothetical protein